MAETMTSPKKETKKFRAEVSQILDIVIHSLYIHREIFIRELVSNAFDALEKMRHESLTAEDFADKDAPLEIRIDTDPEHHQLTITDTGIGMAHDELVENLGTIAHSGTMEYIRNLATKGELTGDLIGKFGVGFYSTFMVAQEVTVRTKSSAPGEPSYEWKSNGLGSYTLTTIENRPRGTSVTLSLKEDAREFENPARIKEIIQKYSNFVPYPILVNGERVNTIQAIWLKTAAEVSEEEYNEFFKFIANSDENPLYHLHLTSDAPIQLASILFVPATNMEQFGFFRLKPSVHLYSKKILLEQNAEDLLPDYLRFVSGVVDSADLSLNISRETIQDNIVFRKLGKFLTRRILKFFSEQSEKEPAKYVTFWNTFGRFIKEGMGSDFEHQKDLMELLRFHSGRAADDELISLKQYVERAPADQRAIYYLSGPSKEDIEQGPYIEAFRRGDIEILYLYDAIDDFIMTSMGEYSGKKLISADAADIELPKPLREPAEEKSALSEQELTNLTSWMKDTLGDRVREVRESKRLIDRPAIIVNPDPGLTTSMRRILKAAGRQVIDAGPQVLEINSRHPLLATIQKLREGTADRGFLQSCVEQIYDIALIEAGLMENPRDLINRSYSIMEQALKCGK